MEGKLGRGLALAMLVAFTLWAFPLAGGTVTAETPCSGAGIVASDNPLPLCGTTTITSNTSRVLRLSVTQDVPFRATRGRGKAIEIAGTGAFSGFALVRDLPGAPGEPLLFEGLLPPEASVGTPNGRYIQSFTPRYSIPKGNYLLYLIADNSPVTVTLRVGGLTGSALYRPTVAAEARVQRLPLTVDSPEPAGFVYSGGAVQPFRYKAGLLFFAHWWGGLAPINFVEGICFYSYDGEDDPPSETDGLFLPGCPPLTDTEHYANRFTFVDVGTYRAQGYVTIPFIPTGEVHSIGLGGYVTSAPLPVEGYGSMAIWLGYSGQPAGVTPTTTVVVPSATATGIVPSVTATAVLPSVTVTGIVPSITATGAVPSVTATGAVPSVTTTGTAVATGTRPGTAVATSTATATPRATGTATSTREATRTARPTGTAAPPRYQLYLPVVLHQPED